VKGTIQRGAGVAAQEWTNRTLAVHERTSVHFLVLSGSLLSITEITESRYFSPLKPIHELIYNIKQNIVPMGLIIETIYFCETEYLHFTTRVFGHSAISPFLSGLEEPIKYFGDFGQIILDSNSEPSKIRGTQIYVISIQLREPGRD